MFEQTYYHVESGWFVRINHGCGSRWYGDMALVEIPYHLSGGTVPQRQHVRANAELLVSDLRDEYIRMSDDKRISITDYKN